MVQAMEALLECGRLTRESGEGGAGLLAWRAAWTDSDRPDAGPILGGLVFLPAPGTSLFAFAMRAGAHC